MIGALMRRTRLSLTGIPLRPRFLRDGASFVACAAAGGMRELRLVDDAQGRPLGAKRVAHRLVSCEQAATGLAGWDRCRASLGSPERLSLTTLDCGNCDHRYVIEVSPAENGEMDALDADYRADWFRFPAPPFDGPRWLHCPRCEVRNTPGLARL